MRKEVLELTQSTMGLEAAALLRLHLGISFKEHCLRTGNALKETEGHQSWRMVCSCVWVSVLWEQVAWGCGTTMEVVEQPIGN